MAEKTYEVIIIGGGIAGLAAAHALRERDIVVYEADDRTGGRVFSQRRQPYWMSVGAHILGGADTAMGRLATDLGLTLVPIQGDMTAIWTNEKLVRGGRPELYPFRLALPFAARLSLIRTGLRFKRAVDRAIAATPDAIHGNREFDGDYPIVSGDALLDERPFSEILGTTHPAVHGLFRSAANRLASEPHELSGHFGSSVIGSLWAMGKRHAVTVEGGLGEITRALSERVGDRIITGAKVSRVRAGRPWAEVDVGRGDRQETVRARFVVFAAQAWAAQETIANLPADKAEALRHVKYGPYVVMAALTRERGPMPYDDLYAVAIGGRTLSMLFNTVNPLRIDPSARTPGGALMMYAGGERAASLMSRSDDAIRSCFLSDVHAIFPEVEGQVEETWIRRLPRGYPFWEPGRLGRQAALARPLENIHFAGDWVEYPSTDSAVRSAQLAARIIRTRLG